MMMEVTPDFNKTAEIAVKNIDNAGGGKVSHPENHITAYLCEKLYHVVMDYMPLSLFWKNNRFSKRVYILYLQFVIPLLFTDSEMCIYFQKVLCNMHSNPATWQRPSKRGDFKRITGIGYLYPSDTNAPYNRHGNVCQLFSYTYDTLFVGDKRYPQSVVDAACACIDNGEPLKTAYECFAPLYYGVSIPPFVGFLNESVYPKYEYDKMTEYFSVLCQRFVEGLVYYQDGCVHLQTLAAFVFGTEMNRGFFTTAMLHAERDDEWSIHSAFVRAAFPYVYTHYVNKRESVYRLMRLTEDEKADYDQKYFSAPIKRHMFKRMLVSVDESKDILPHGTSYTKMRFIVNRYYENEVAATRVIPQNEIIQAGILKSLPSGSAELADFKRLIYSNALRPWLSSVMEDKANELRRRFEEGNADELSTDKNKVVLYFFNKGRYITRSIDYSPLGTGKWRTEMQVYCRDYISTSITVPRMQVINALIEFICFVKTEFRDFCTADIKTPHIRIYLHRLQMQGLSASTVSARAAQIRGFIDTIINSPDISPADKPESNVGNPIRFFGVRQHAKETPIIPDDILCFLDAHIGECSDSTRLIYLLMKQTCWRFDDVSNIRTNGIYLLDSIGEYAGVRTEMQKTERQRRRDGLDKMVEDVIPVSLYEELQSYIAATQIIRDRYETDYVFFSVYGGMPHQVSPSVFNQEVQGLLKKHGIISVDETYDRFYSRQSRTTGATILIESGAQLNSVQQKLHHKDPSTTAQHYARVRKHLLAEKDSEFFKKEFGSLFDPEKFSRLTEDERQALYRDFLLNRREVEFGICTRLPGDGSCGTLGQWDCPCCPKLVTGPEYLPRWQELLQSCNAIVSELEKTYREAGIPAEEFKEYREYEQEVRRRDSISAVVEKINEDKS